MCVRTHTYIKYQSTVEDIDASSEQYHERSNQIQSQHQFPRYHNVKKEKDV